jgi:hypothetical protein
VVEEPASGAYGQVGVEGEELRELERLEAVDDEGFGERKVLQERRVEEQAVATETGEVAGDGRVGGSEEAGDLPEAGAFGGVLRDGAKELGTAEPVGDGEGPGGEATTAVQALKAAEPSLVTSAAEEAAPNRAPSMWLPVEAASGIRAERGMKASASPTDGSLSNERHGRRT